MRIKHMFKKTVRDIRGEEHENTPEVPDNLMRKCNACKAAVFVDEVKQNHYICPHCGNYFHVPAYRRIKMIADRKSFVEWDAHMEERNPLQYKGYEEKLRALREKTGLDEAVVTGKCTIKGTPVALGVCDCRFMMSSMGEIVGEKITRVFERATEEQLPVILYICSGGARMQEGLVSLMQMAKTSMAIRKHSDAGLLYVPVLTDPTTGGVTASFAMLGDIILAEPGALIGFAGPRVIQQTIGQKLPEGFQRAEFLLEHGFVDKIVPRDEQKRVIADILRMHRKPDALTLKNAGIGRDGQAEASGKFSFNRSGKSAWDTVLLSRDGARPVATDYIDAIFDDFMEFHGDRYFKDDGAIVGGIATFKGIPVTVIGQQKGKTTKENIRRNFGMPSPDGYRKALRLMQQAETFGRPIICFVDTPGAFCGIEAEERGQGEAIARNLFEMASLTVPVLSLVIGEGGSGGALAMAVANEVWMMENAIYSILSPEGFASILWKDSKKAADAARVMKITAADLCEMGLIEDVIPEKQPACADTMPEIAGIIREKLSAFLNRYENMKPEELAEQRYQRFRRI